MAFIKNTSAAIFGGEAKLPTVNTRVVPISRDEAAQCEPDPRALPDGPFEPSPEQMEFLKTKIRKSIAKGLLQKGPEGEDPEIVVEQWAQTLIDPRALFDDIISKWFTNNEASKTVRVAFVLNSNPDPINKFAAKYTPGTPYNALHAAIRIYDHVIDWRDNSIAYPRKANISDPLMMLSLGEITIENLGPTEGFYSEAIEAICEGLKAWNLTQKYAMFKCNCAHFYEDILQRVQKVAPSVKVPESTANDRAIEVFLKRVKNGVIEKTITQDMFDFKLTDIRRKPATSVTFSSHAMLDIWTNNLFTQFKGAPYFTQKYPNTRELLKSFDRAFRRDHSRFMTETTNIDALIIELETKLRNNPPNKAELEKKLDKLRKRQESIKAIIGISQHGANCPFPPEAESELPTPASTKILGSAYSNQSGNSNAGGSATGGSRV